MISKKSLTDISLSISAHHIGQDTVFNNISIDTRTLKIGNLFVAIKGPNFDGHNFIGEALDKGASAIVTENHIGKIICLIKF